MALVQLYPQPTTTHELTGLYLGHDLRRLAADRPFVYTNYVASIDGRIAVPRQSGRGMTVPKDVANDRDWRLFQELAVQADVILTSGRYLRDYAEGTTQEILEVYDDPAFTDLKDWREAHGLKPQPDLAVISGSLDFPVPDALTANGRRVVIATTARAEAERVKDLEDQAGDVVIAGGERVEGKPLIDALAARGYGLIYNATGPKVMHLLLADNMLDRLYLTLANRLIGGDPFSGIVEGPLLEEAVDLQLNTLYFDADGLDGVGQMFVSYARKS